MKRVVVVLGYGAEQIRAHIDAHSWPIPVQTVRNEGYHSPNGTSLLVAEPLVAAEETLLAMCDHLVEPALYRRVAASGASGGARLGIDRRIGSDWVDLEDVTRVQTADDRILAIGKGLVPYDCFDTGVFAIGPALFAALRTLNLPSITEGMRALCASGKAQVVDCSELRWIDVDDEPSLEKAERWVAAAAS